MAWALLALMMTITVPRESHANAGTTFLETMGVSIAVGTVLGASTLPFYAQPGNQLTNIAIGAGAGAAVGVGILIYSLFGGAAQDSQTAELDFDQPKKPILTQTMHRKLRMFAQGTRLQYSQISQNASIFPEPSSSSLRARFVTPADFWMPLVSVNW